MNDFKEIIEEYWDEEYFSEIDEQLLCICERDFGDENRVGICIKKENNIYNVVIRYGTTSVSKSYTERPTKEKLITDFI